jgi:hypothetical protein
MRNGRNPTRRNRNIGTAKQGHGKKNKHVVPRAWLDSVWDWKRRPEHVVVTRQVWGRELPFMVEHTRADSVHACTVDDVAEMLRLLPKRHINSCEGITGVQGIIFRQPTRRETCLRPVWARLGFAVDVGPVTGPAIMLEAQTVPLRLKWGRHLGPSDERELTRLQSAATETRSDRRHHHLLFDLAGVRRVQLFHSLPHEVGHWADMLENVELPSYEDHDLWQSLWERYWQRPHVEREEFAHRYAEQAVAELRESGQVPFRRQLSPEALAAEGLRVEDFQPST